MNVIANTTGFRSRAAIDERLSKAEAVYRLLREEIVTATHAPGSLIDKGALCARFDVSRFPVSDALSRLAREGLVVIEPQRGSRVAGLDLKKLRSAGFVRRAMEADACEAVASRAAPSLALRLHEMLATQRNLVAAGDVEAFYRADRQFHEAIVDALGMPYVSETNGLACALLERVQRLAMWRVGGMAGALAQHEAIVGAIEERDGAKAAAAMREHVNTLIAAIDEVANARPELFRT